jgi:TPR repeat protein
MNLFRSLFLAVILSVSSGSVATAQDFDKGLVAHNAGDFVTALEEWRPLAEQGDAAAQYNFGLMYENGNGVLQDYAEAVRWYRLAAEQGNARAQTNLGGKYEFGSGVLQDNVKAHMWYNIGAANGNALGGENRGKIADQMTPADISQAQAMARECMSSGYSDCGW